MSRANRLHAGAPEDGPRACDYYATPAWATASIMPLVMSMRLDVIIDPCAGDGAILREARRCIEAKRVPACSTLPWPPKLMGCEIRPEAVEQCVADGLDVVQADFLNADDWARMAERVNAYLSSVHPERVRKVVFLMNPPYGGRDNTAQIFVDTCLRRLTEFHCCEGSVIALLWMMWLNDGQATHMRGTWLREIAGLPYVAMLPRRPKFTGKGHDATTYAWMEWPSHDRNWTKSSLTLIGDLGGNA